MTAWQAGEQDQMGRLASLVRYMKEALQEEIGPEEANPSRRMPTLKRAEPANHQPSRHDGGVETRHQACQEDAPLLWSQCHRAKRRAPFGV